MTEIRMPKPGDAITEAEVTEFYVAEGQSAVEGDPLYAIATDKVEMDIEAPASGVVTWNPVSSNSSPITAFTVEIIPALMFAARRI